MGYAVPPQNPIGKVDVIHPAYRFRKVLGRKRDVEAIFIADAMRSIQRPVQHLSRFEFENGRVIVEIRSVRQRDFVALA